MLREIYLKMFSGWLRPRWKTPNTIPRLDRRGMVYGRLMRIAGRSMMPSFEPGELVCVDEQAYARRAPRRNEVVAARPRALGGKALVKRVAGLPHERVEVEGKRWQLGAEEFFLLGDYRQDSVDSRRFGPVGREELVGPVRRLRLLGKP